MIGVNERKKEGTMKAWFSFKWISTRLLLMGFLGLSLVGPLVATAGAPKALEMTIVQTSRVTGHLFACPT